jgi:hypothetical protein
MNSLNKHIHVFGYLRTFISVSNGKIINITEPSAVYCSLAKHLYHSFPETGEPQKNVIKEAIKQALDWKLIIDYLTLFRKLKHAGIKKIHARHIDKNIYNKNAHNEILEINNETNL